MKLNKISTSLGLVASSVLFMSNAPAQAFNFTSGTDLGSCASLVNQLSGAGLDPTTLNSCKTGDGFNLVAGPSELGAKLQGKAILDNKFSDDGYQGLVRGVGVSLPIFDSVPGEISYAEYLDLVLPKTGVLESIDLSFLYKPGHKGDNVFEVSFLSSGDNGFLTGTLQVLDEVTASGNTLARWTVGALGINTVFEAISASVGANGVSGGGWYRILNPFGNKSISQIRLSAPIQTGANPFSPANNDYSLVGAKMKQVPEPATLLGLGLVAGLMAVSRKRQQLRKAL